MKYFVAGLEVYEETVCLVLRTGGRQLRIGLPFAETLTPDELRAHIETEVARMTAIRQRFASADALEGQIIEIP